jgi:outer membrane lipoprotein-sorting protein
MSLPTASTSSASGLALLLLLTGATWAAPPSPVERLEALITRVDAAQKDLRTLRAEFVQKNRVRLFRQEMVSRGRLLYQRGEPTRLRWEYTAPDPSSLLVVGQRAYLQMPGRPAQVFDTGTDSTLRAIISQLELWLGSRSLRSAQKDYDLQLGGGRGTPALLLTPRPGSPLAKAFSRIELRFDERTALLRGLLLSERGGDEKEITFTRLERNVPLPEAAFQP